MTKCSKCGKEMGFFEKTFQSDICEREDCNKEFCKDCKGTSLSVCDKCKYTYCSDHIKNHVCEQEGEDEELEDESNSLEDTPVKYFGANKSLAIIYLEDIPTDKKLAEIYLNLRKEGYDVSPSNGSFKSISSSDIIVMEHWNKGGN